MIQYVHSKICQAHIEVLPLSVIISKFWQNCDTNLPKEISRQEKMKAKIKSLAYIQLGEKVLQTVHQTFTPDIPVFLHLPALVDSTIDSDSPPTLYVIQEGINCMPTTDYFFTNIKPAPIVVTRPTAHHNKPTAQQAATQDPVSQQTHPLQPGKTRVYPSMLANKQVPVLNLTETSMTS